MPSTRSRTAVVGGLWAALRSATRPGSPGLVTRLRALPRLAVATATGRYHGPSAWRLLGILAALLYVVSPVDVMPEALLGIFGLADDAVVLSWIAVAVVNETEQFLAWEGDPLRRAPSGGSGSGAGSSFGSAAGATVPGRVVD